MVPRGGLVGEGTRDAPLFLQKIAVLTDGMVVDGKPGLAAFRDIFIPFETSMRNSAAVLEAFAGLPASSKRRIRCQRGPMDTGTGTYAEWVKASRTFRDTPAPKR